MLRKVNVGANQQVTPEDYNKFGEFPRQTFDHLGKDAITDLQAFVGFTVARSGVAEVTVAAGRYWEDGKMYIDDGVIRLPMNLLDYLAASTKRIVTIAVQGTLIDTDTEPRTFLLDPTAHTTEPRTTSTESMRRVTITAVPGVENATPSPPALGANLLAVAYVTVSSTDVIEVHMVDANRLPSIKTLNTRLTLVEKRLDQAGSQIDTLRTDISGLMALLKTKAPFWKKEETATGARWVDARESDDAAAARWGQGAAD